MFMSVKTAHLGSKWQSESEKMVHALFELARAEARKPSVKFPGQKAGCIIFIDEIDAVCKARGEGNSEGSGADRKVTNQFLQEVSSAWSTTRQLTQLLRSLQAAT